VVKVFVAFIDGMYRRGSEIVRDLFFVAAGLVSFLLIGSSHLPSWVTTTLIMISTGTAVFLIVTHVISEIAMQRLQREIDRDEEDKRLFGDG
jgi:hypothetical protein